MNPLMTSSLAEIHNAQLLAEAAEARRAVVDDRSPRAGVRERARRMIDMLATRVHRPRLARG